jgi:hypothetical protein
MRRPRRLSRPTTSERRRPRSEPSDRPASFRGIWTRRPSARIAMATWRRLRPSNRAKDGLPNNPGEPGRSAQSTSRPMIMQPPGVHRTASPAVGQGSRPAHRRGNGGHRSSGAGAAGHRARGAEGRPCPETARPPVARRSRSHQRRRTDAWWHSVARPALAGLQNECGSGQCGQSQKNPEGLSLQKPSHLLSTSAGRRRG